MVIPEERHEREQYFFRPATLAEMCLALSEFENPCVLCAPLLGAEMARKRRVRVLDIDERFSHVAGFRRWDVRRPEHIGEAFGVIICDPPFFTVSLSQLFRAVRLLAGQSLGMPLALTYLSRRSAAAVSVFQPFNLRPTGYRPEYHTVRNEGRTSIEVFANFDCSLWRRSAKCIAGG